MITNEEKNAISDGLAFARLPRTFIKISGGDRHTFLHNLCTNEVKTLATGTGCEAFFTNVQGKTLCHCLLTCFEDSILISTDANLSDQLLPHLDKYLIREDVQLLDASEEIQAILLSGPKASDWLTEQLASPPSEMLSHVASKQISSASVVRVPYANQAYFVLVAQQQLEQVVTLLTAPEIGSHEIGCEAIEWQRISARFPSSGRDVKPDNLPQEIDRNDQAISFVKGCYLGQETVARLDALGHVNKKLVRLEFDSSAVPADGTELKLDDKAVGVVTSAVVSPDEQSAVGLGMVRVKAIEAGVSLDSEFGSVKVTA